MSTRVARGLVISAVVCAVATGATAGEDSAVASLYGRGMPGPPFSAATKIEIARSDVVADNIRAMSALYVAAQLDEMGLFAVADRIAEEIDKGVIPIRSAKTELARYRRSAPQRLDLETRRKIYAHAFGTAGASPSPDLTANTEFVTLWGRYVASLQAQPREPRLDAGATPAPSAGHEAGRDLAINLSKRGYGGAAWAAAQIAQHASDAEQLLSIPAVLARYGARDLWGVVDKIARTHAGPSVNVARLRAKAEAGRRLLDSLAGFERTQTPPLSSELARFAERWEQAAAGERPSAPPAEKPGGHASASEPGERGSEARLGVRVRLARKQTPVVALCFDASRRLVRCVVEEKGEASPEREEWDR